jgi:hypothetical protein
MIWLQRDNAFSTNSQSQSGSPRGSGSFYSTGSEAPGSFGGGGGPKRSSGFKGFSKVLRGHLSAGADEAQTPVQRPSSLSTAMGALSPLARTCRRRASRLTHARPHVRHTHAGRFFGLRGRGSNLRAGSDLGAISSSSLHVSARAERGRAEPGERGPG